MAEWTETFRGAVAPWECDTTEHFTIAYYLDRIDQASTTLADLIGLADRQRAGIWPRRFVLRFLRELRAGASFHIESAPLGLDPGLRLGHRVVDSGNGEIVTWIEELWEQMAPSDVERAAIGRRLAVWQGPSIEERPEPNSMAGAIAAARGRTRPADLDEFGRFSLAAFVHRFTDAVIQTCAALGMTDDFMKTARRGYSTFELVLRIVGVPRLGDPYLVETGIAQLGGSSLRLLHRMSDPVSGTEFARLGQLACSSISTCGGRRRCRKRFATPPLRCCCPSLDALPVAEDDMAGNHRVNRSAREDQMRIWRGARMLLLVATTGILAMPVASRAQVGISVAIAPPPLPVYAQPPIPAPGYLWTPGYWGGSSPTGPPDTAD